jgi:hypothetical protein
MTPDYCSLIVGNPLLWVAGGLIEALVLVGAIWVATAIRGRRHDRKRALWRAEVERMERQLRGGGGRAGGVVRGGAREWR